MSNPVPQKKKDPAESGKSFVCPTCRRIFAELGAPAQCPDDGTFLLRQRDLYAAERDPMVGRNLEGRYTILSRLGAGSMGTVYRARQHAMGREVAIKILRPDRALDETSKARFLREARANSLLASPNTVTVFDFGEAQSGELYLAMELLEGESVGQRLARLGRLKLEDAAETTRQALRSLGEAHAKGIVHRDLKPDNLFYARVIAGGSDEELVKVLDFGIAKMLREDSAHLNAIETQAGTVFGTPRYMSPEQAQGKPLDARSDLYSLGVILYQMLTGRPPFTDDDAIVVMARHIKTAPRPPTEACPEAKIPPEIERVVMRTLSKDARDRPDSADMFATELARAMETATPTTSGIRRSVGDSQPQGHLGPPSISPMSAGPAIGASGVPDAVPSSPMSELDLVIAARDASRRNLFLGLFLVALALVTGIVVYFAVKKPPPQPVATQPSSPARASSSLVLPALDSIPTSVVLPGASASDGTPDGPPGISPEVLPKAHGAQNGSNGTGGQNGNATPASRPNGRPGGRPHPNASASAGGYGIFD